MEILREVNGVQLNKGDGMARGLFNLSNDSNEVSFWFDEETKNELMEMSDEEFYNESESQIKISN